MASTQPVTNTIPPGQPSQPNTPGITGDWSGYRSRLAAGGLTVAAGIYYDYSRNLQGGISTDGDAGRELFDLDITLATDHTPLNLSGGILFFNFLGHEGNNGTARLTGDAQGFDNQDGFTGEQLYQFFYRQDLGNGKLWLKIGRIDYTTDFAYTVNGLPFLNSSFGFSPALVSFPTYPDPALGANIFWTPTAHFYASGGVADANQSERAGIFSGDPYLFQAPSGGVFLITEAGFKWALGKNDDQSGRIAIGGYHHTGEFRRFDGADQNGASGMYAVFDQTLYHTDQTDLGTFAQYGLADAKIARIDQHIGGGLTCTGPLPIAGRDKDILGVGPSFVHFSNEANLPHSYELAIESFYKVQISPWFNVQPDLQYIVHPGGADRRDALVATLRAELDF